MSGITTLVLDGELSIVDATRQHGLLMAAAATAQTGLVLELGALEACDSAGVQLLLALRRSLSARGAGLELRTVPDCVRSALSSYGLDTGLLPLLPTAEAA